MDRDEFINMMIAELSKQKEEDTQAFEKPKELTPTEIFKKLCYDYPTVTNSQLALLKKHIERIAVDGNNYIVGNSSNRIINSTDSNSSIDTEFKNVFCFDPKFLENIIELTTGDSWQSVPTSNSDGISTETDPDAEPGEEEANKEEMTRKASLVGEAKSICSIMFLIFPNYLLNCSLQQSSKLLCTDNSAAIDRAELLLEYKSFCSLSTVSKIAIEVLSFGCNTYLNYTIGYIKQLADIIHNSIHSDGNAVVAGSISVGATTKLIDALTLASQLSYSTNEHATDSSTKESSDKTNTDTNLQSVCKDILVHTVFLLRDLLLADVNLLPKYFPLLLESITFKKATAGILSSDFGKLSGTSSLYPNSIECLYVLLVGNVVESLYPSNMSDVYNNSLSNNSKTSKRFSSNYLIARKSVRSLFIKESTIQYFVDICQRMIEHRQQIHKIVSIEDNVAGGSSLDNFYNSIDADAVNFLLDAAMIFFVDIPEGSMSNNATDNSSKVINSFTKGIFESLSTTRMLPMILDLFVKLLSHYCNNITINDKTIVLPRVPAIMKALCDRLLKFLSLLSLQSELSVNYVVRYPGFISSLNTVYTTLWIPMLSILVNDSNDPMCSIQSRVATLTTKSESECGINSIIAEANKVFSPEGFICLLVGIYMNCGDATINKTISNYFERALALSLAFMFEITRNNNRMISVNGDVNDAQQSVTDSPSKQNTELKSSDSVESLIAEKRGITFKVLPLLEAIAAISLPFYGGTTFGFYLSQNDQRVHFVRQKLVSFNSLLSQLVQINLNNNLVTEKCSVAVTEKKDTAIKLAKDGVSDTNTINIDFDQCTTTLRVLDPKIMPMLSTDSMNTMKRLLKSLSALLESRVSNKVD